MTSTLWCCIMVSTIRLGQWGYYALKPKTAVFPLWRMRHIFSLTKQMFDNENHRRIFSSQATKKTHCLCAMSFSLGETVKTVPCRVCCFSSVCFVRLGKVSTSPVLKVCGRLVHKAMLQGAAVVECAAVCKDN